jgi:hypothetical protein
MRATLRGTAGRLYEFPVNRRFWMCAKFAAVVVGSGPLAAPVAACAGWTFCIAEASPRGEIWITGVFAATRERERLEGDFRAYLKSRGVEQSVAQCPAAKDDKTEMINAQITAAEFHRKLGDALHEVIAPEFDPRR